MLIETSKDIFYLILAFSILLFTVFLVWLLAESALVLHRANRLIKEIQEKLRKIEVALMGIRDKLEHSAGYLSLLAAAAKQIIQMVMSRRPSKRRK